MVVSGILRSFLFDCKNCATFLQYIRFVYFASKIKVFIASGNSHFSFSNHMSVSEVLHSGM